MPLFSSQLQLNTAASASGTPLADVAAIKGAFKVYPTYEGLSSVPVSLISNKQIVWVEVDAHAVRKRPECGGVVLQGGVGAGAGVAWRLCVCVLSLKLSGLLSGAVRFLRGVLPTPAGNCV